MSSSQLKSEETEAMTPVVTVTCGLVLHTHGSRGAQMRLVPEAVFAAALVRAKLVQAVGVYVTQRQLRAAFINVCGRRGESSFFLEAEAGRHERRRVDTIA